MGVTLANVLIRYRNVVYNNFTKYHDIGTPILVQNEQVQRTSNSRVGLNKHLIVTSLHIPNKKIYRAGRRHLTGCRGDSVLSFHDTSGAPSQFAVDIQSNASSLQIRKQEKMN